MIWMIFSANCGTNWDYLCFPWPLTQIQVNQQTEEQIDRAVDNGPWVKHQIED
jgi:hypothetical protein